MLPPTPPSNIFACSFLVVENVFVPLLAGKHCVQVIAHYNPCMVVGSPRAGGCTPLTPAATHRTPPTEKLKIMKQQTSIHVQPVKGGSEQHNKREKELDYIRPELSHLNEYWEKDTQTDRLENIKSRYLKSTGQRFGIDTFQIAIHKDEGYPQVEEWKPNLHAHLVFDWTDQETGKSLKLNRQDMVEMQTITAEVLQMDRGVSSDKQHLTAQQYKSFAEEAKLRRLEEERARKEKQMKEELERFKVAKAHKEAAIETAKTLSEGVKGLFGQSSKDKTIKALREQINTKQKEIFDIKAGMVGLKAQQEEQKEQQKAALNETRREAVSKYNELVVKHNKVVERNEELQEVIKDFQEIPIIERCLAIIRSFVFHICGRFDADDRRLLSFVMQGNEDAAKSLRNAAFNLGGVICQYQYGSRWDQAERELRNIANGVREEEQQQRNRGLRR